MIGFRDMHTSYWRHAGNSSQSRPTV